MYVCAVCGFVCVWVFLCVRACLHVCVCVLFSFLFLNSWSVVLLKNLDKRSVSDIVYKKSRQKCSQDFINACVCCYFNCIHMIWERWLKSKYNVSTCTCITWLYIANTINMFQEHTLIFSKIIGNLIHSKHGDVNSPKW